MRSRTLVAVGVALGAVLASATGVAIHRSADSGHHGATSSAGHPPRPSAAPGSARASHALPVHPTGRGHGYVRVIPCYLLTQAEIGAVLGSPMAFGQRAAGAEGDELTGTALEDCYWFSTEATGPWIRVGTLTTTELRDRGVDATARTFFEAAHRGDRTYLPHAGDSAYIFGPASAAVLVGDVYLEVTVVTTDHHPLADARRLARLVARLHLSGP